MTELDRDGFDDLLSRQSLCVSILLPTHRAGRELQQAKIRLKNLLREAEGRLLEEGAASDEARSLLAPGEELLQREGPWRHLSDGLALYLAPDFSRTLMLALPLEEAMLVGRRFYVLPLLPLLADRRGFFVLALSQKKVRLFFANRFREEELELEGVPTSLGEVVGEDWKPTTLQSHSTGATGTGATFHGQGGVSDSEKEELVRFCQRLDTALRERLGNGDRPLLLAGVDYLTAIYRRVSRYPGLLEERLTGSAEVVAGDELRRRAWDLVEPHLRSELEDELDQCRGLLGTGRASVDPQEIVPAAFDGRIETLFLATGTRRWGSFDEGSRSLTLSDEPAIGSEELLNLTAAQALSAGGTVRLLDPAQVPEGAAMAAVFRY